MGRKVDDSDKKSDSVDLEELLREKERLDSLIKRQFTRKITVMFTDLTGSTHMSEVLGDLAMRAILKNHNEIVFPLIDANNGTLVKTMGDGTMSYFVEAADAVRAAIAIQQGIEEYNKQTSQPPLLIRCGLNTGLGIVEKKDVYGDVVNVAQRFEALAEPREILLSEETYEGLENKEEFCVAYLKEASLKGKMGPQKVYKALWEPADVEHFKSSPETYMPRWSDGVPTADMPAVKPDTGSHGLGQIIVEREGEPADTFEVTGFEMIIGRSTKADIHLPEAFVSRNHAKVFMEDTKLYIEDLGSNLGTVCDGEKITRRELADGDQFLIGSIKLIFEAGEEPQVEPGADDSGEEEATVVFNVKSIRQLIVMESGQIVSRHELGEKPLSIGRVAKCDVKLANPIVSRHHARIYMADEQVHIEDMKSNNGTYVNGTRIEKAAVGLDDEIKIGPFFLRVIDPTRPEPELKEDLGTFTRKMFSFLTKK